MTLTLMLNNAVSGIQASQVALKNTSNNISNVNTEGYARRETEFTSNVLNGAGSGVAVGNVERITDAFLTTEVLRASSGAAEFEMAQKFHDRIQTFLGSPDDSASLTGRINTALSEISTLSLDPNSAARRLTVVTNLQGMLRDISYLAEQVQQIRADVDTQITADIDKLNLALTRLDELNDIIKREQVLSTDTADLEESRVRAMKEISEVIAVRFVYQPNGEVHVSTTGGQILLDSNRYDIQYDPVGVATTSATYDTITAHKVGINTGVAETDGTAFEAKIEGGTLNSLLTLRDVTMPDLATQLGELASQITDAINAIHNDSSAVPPPNVLQGHNTGLLGSDEHGFTGTTNMVISQPDGTMVTSLTINFTASPPTIDVDNAGTPTAAAGTTIDDLMTAMRTALGTNGTVTFTQGAMSIDVAGSANGASFLQPTTGASDRGGRGFSHFFGLNDLIKGDITSHFDTGLLTGAAHGYTTGQELQLQFKGQNSEVALEATVAMTTGESFTDLISDLNTEFSGFATFALNTSTGALEVTPAAAYATYEVEVVGDSTARGNTGLGFGQMFGLGDRYKSEQALDLEIREDIVANNGYLAAAKLDFTNTTSAGDLVLTIGDNRGAVGLDQIQNQTFSWTQQGGVSAFSGTIAQYTGALISDISQQGNQIDFILEDRASLLNEIDLRLQNFQGVNLDEELSNMVVFQTAYQASARVIRAADELFDTLLAAV